MVIREQYLQKLRQLKDKKLIKVVTGIRRCGKSTLLEQFRDELLAEGVDESQTIFLNFEALEMEELRDYKKLHDHILGRLQPDKANYVFLDEIQNVTHFERAVDSLFVKDNVDLYITGSNAYMLSGELATLLSGRYISLHVLPFSFAEYCEAFYVRQGDILPIELLPQYLDSSSFPEAVALQQTAPAQVNHYLRDIVDSVIYKDISQRHDIRSMPKLEKTLQFLLSSVGSNISSKRIADTLGDVSHTTVSNYITYLTEAYIFYRSQRYDIKGKRLLKTQEKYYAVDLGLRNILLSEPRGADRGHKLENIVYLELLRRGGEVRVGKHSDNEVDFLVQDGSGQRSYYQIAYTAVEDSTLARELRPLLAIKDNYPKYLITTDLGSETHAGIKQINAADWLLDL